MWAVSVVPLDVAHLAAARVDFYVVLAAVSGADFHVEMIIAAVVVAFHARDPAAFHRLPGDLRGAFVRDVLFAVAGVVGVVIIGAGRGRGEDEGRGDIANALNSSYKSSLNAA